MHYHMIEDDSGDLIDLIELCSDECHRQWCIDNDEVYQGWNGCQEQEAPAICASCGTKLITIEQ